MSATIKPEFMNLTQLAAYLGFSRRTLEKWVAADKIAVTRIGRSVRVPMSEVDRLANDSAMPKGQ